MKRILLVLLIIFAFFRVSFGQSGIESGLVAKYCFSGNANDALGVRNATVYGATLTNDRFGNPNEAYSFNGISDYIQMPSDVWVSGNFSFTGWIYVNTVGYWSRFFEWGNGIDMDNVFFSPCQGGGATGVLAIHQCSSSARDYASSAAGAFPVKSWVHIAITLSGDTATVYKNNTFWYKYKMAYVPCATIRTQCYFGKSDFPWDKSLDGKIDDVRIYNRVLSVAEIDTIYHLTGCSVLGTISCTTPVTIIPKVSSLCFGDTVTLHATGALHYSWSPSLGLSDSNAANPILTGKSSKRYIVKGTDSNGCIGFDSLDIIVHPNPIVVINPKVPSLCLGDIITLNVTGALHYSWSPALGLSDSGIANPVLTGIASEQYLVKGTDINGCSALDSMRVMVNNLPVISAIPHNILACVGKTVQLKATGASNYLWTPSLGLSMDNIANPLLTVNAATSKYMVKGTDLNGCSNYDSITIQFAPGPVIIALPHDTMGCNSVTIQLNVAGASQYKWFPPTGLNADDISNPQLTIAGSIKYVVTGTDTNGCTGTDTVSIIQYPAPNVIASAEGASDCSNTEVQLNATGALSYSWDPGFYCDNSFISNPKVKVPYTLVFTVTGVNANGCVGKDTVVVLFKGKSKIGIPNAFTPNNDQINDDIRPIIICDFTMAEFSIFNRWGQNIFTTNDPNKPWDGTFKGVPCDVNVYYYFIKGKNSMNEDVTFKGDITLIR